MKKLLVATSALIAAGSAAALDVTLGGEIESVVSYDASTSSTANDGAWNANALTGSVDLTVSGESMGWTYGGGMDLAGNVASLTLGNAAFGSLKLANGECGDFVEVAGDRVAALSGVAATSSSVGSACMEWSTGASLMGFGLNAAMDLSNAQGTAVVGLTGDLAGMSMAAEVELSTDDFDAILGTSVAGASISIEATGNLASLNAASYVAEVSTSAMGFDLGLTADGGSLGYSAAMGGLKFSGTAAGDFLGSLSVEYAANLADGLDTTVAYAGDTGDLTITTTMAF